MGPAPLCVLACLLSAPVYTQEKAPPRYRLENVKHVQGFVGSPKARETLAQHGFVVTERQFQDMAGAYQESGRNGSNGEGSADTRVPKFITVDSAWETYHAILESAMGQLAERQDALLREFSTRLHELAAARSEGHAGVYADLAEFAAVAVALQNGGVPASPAPTGLARIFARAASDGNKPRVEAVLRAMREDRQPQPVLFFGLPLAPSQYRLTAAGGKTVPLPGNLAARQWFSTCVFRLNSDAETRRAICLALLIDKDKELRVLYERLTAPGEALIGPPDSAGVPQYAALARALMGRSPSHAKLSASLAVFRRMAAEFPEPKINDQWLPQEQQARFAAEIKGFRLLPPPRLPAIAVFQRTAKPAVRGRQCPSGLDVFAVGPLACPSARRALRVSLLQPEVTDAVFQASAAPLPSSIAGRTLDLARVLQSPLPATAPATLRTSVWRDKQVWTSLGALARQHHALTPRGNVGGVSYSSRYGGRGGEPLGYVSPYPDFFRRLAMQARDSADIFEAAIAQGPTDAKAAGKLLLDCLDIYHRQQSRAAAPQGSDGAFDSPAEDDGAKLGQLRNLAARYFATAPGPGVGRRWNAREREDQLDLLDTWENRLHLLALARRWLTAEDITPADRSLMRALHPAQGQRAEPQFSEFAALCDTLAAIAEKELRAQPLSGDEYRMIRDYGSNLAQFSVVSHVRPAPSDDPFGDEDGTSRTSPGAPAGESLPVSPLFPCGAAAAARETKDAAAASAGGGSSVLYAAASRPEAIYVILEINGQPVLHRGAVSSYREFLRPAEQPVNDRSWAAEVRARSEAAPPAFTQAFRQTMTEEEVLTLLRAGQVYEGATQMHSPAITRAMIQAVDGGTAQDVRWFLRQICARATQPSAGELLALMRKLPTDYAGELAPRIHELNWSAHRAALTEMLSADSPELADAAAYILARHPERIDVNALAAGFGKQKPRTRRLYCYLAGKIKWNTSPVAVLVYPARDQKTNGMLRDALKDENEGVRYQAAIAVLQRGSRQPEVLDRLIVALDDPNQVVAAAIAHTLRELKVKRAAPAMLARLRKIVHSKPIDPEELDRQQESVNQDANHNGSYTMMVLAGHAEPDGNSWPQIATLGDELLQGMGTLQHAPAADLLRELVALPPKLQSEDEPEQPQYGPKALDVLVELDPKQKTEVLLRIASDRKIPTPMRAHALVQLGELKDSKQIEKVLPLLNETDDGGASNGQGNPFDGRMPMRHAAALAIANSLSNAETAGRSPALRDKVQAQLREMLRGPHASAALAALIRMGMKDQAAFLLTIVHDKSAPVDLRSAALSQMHQQGPAAQRVRNLLPLLDETEGDRARLCEEAVQMIGSAVESLDKDPIQRAALRKSIEPRLRAMLHGEHGHAAYYALQRFYRNDGPELLASLARDDKVPGELRVRAMRDLAWQGDLATVRTLLPLLEDATPAENQVPISHFAASTISVLLGSREGFGNYMDPEAQAEFLQRVRQSVFDAGIK